MKSLCQTRLSWSGIILTDYCRNPAPPVKKKRDAGFVRSLLIKCFLSKILTYNAQFNFCCHCLAPFPGDSRSQNRRSNRRSAFASHPSSGPLTVPSFSDETPESNFQRSGALAGFRATKILNSIRHSDGERSGMPFSSARIRSGSVCQDKVEST